MQLRLLTGWVFMALIVLSCGSETTEKQEPEPAIDPLTGIDTTRPLITAAELAEMDHLVLIPFKTDSGWGYANTNMDVVIRPQYQLAAPFSENLAVVMRDSLLGVIDKRGRELIPPKFARITRSACGVFTVQTPAGYLLLRRDGRRFRPEVFDRPFKYVCSENRIPVSKERKIAFLDEMGKAVTDFEYDAIYKFRHGRAPVRKGPSSTGKWGAIDADGKLIVDFEYDVLFPFVNGLSVGQKTDSLGEAKWGVIDTAGQPVIPFEYGRLIGSFSGDYIVGMSLDPNKFSETTNEKVNTWLIFDRTGTVIGASGIELWDDFSEGLVVAKDKGKFGFADHTGKIVIPCRYEWACGFSEGMAWVKKNGRYGFIDREGKIVIPFVYGAAYDYVYMQKDGVQVADPETGELFYIDKRGREYRAKS